MEASYSHNPAMFKNSPFGFILAVLLIPVFGVGILILLWWYVSCRALKLEVIGDDVVLETGILSKQRTELSTSSIRTVKVSQSFFNRIFDVGKIEVFTAGDRPEVAAAGMPDPHAFREIVKNGTADAAG